MRTTRAGESSLLLMDAIDILKNAGVDYAVIGAMAASFYGVVRGSADADAVLSLTTISLQSLESDFKRAGFLTELRRGDHDDPIPAVLALTDSFANRVDLLAGIRGMDPDAFSRVVEIDFKGDPLRMIGLEDFIAMKVFAGGPKDLDDARQAMAVSKEAINRVRLEKLTARYGRNAEQTLKNLLG